MVLPGAPAPCDGNDHGNVGGIDLLLVWDAHGPGQAAFAQTLAEWSAQPIVSIRKHAAKACTRGPDPIDLCQCDLWLAAIDPAIFWNTGAVQPGCVAGPALGQEHSPTITGTSCEARVTDTSV